MEKDKFVGIQEWMLEFDLSASELIAFAVISGFSQDGKSTYKGGYEYLKKWLKVSTDHTVCSILRKLIKMGLIVCEESRKGAIKTCEYRVSSRLQKLHSSDCKKCSGTTAKNAVVTTAKIAVKKYNMGNITGNKEEKEEKEESPQPSFSIFDTFQKLYGKQ